MRTVGIGKYRWLKQTRRETASPRKVVLIATDGCRSGYGTLRKRFIGAGYSLTKSTLENKPCLCVRCDCASPDEVQLLKYEYKTFGLLREAGVSLKVKKSAFFRRRVDYLRHTILPGKRTVAV